jgi:molecular chaperone DnaK (HSP70)
LWWAAEEAKKKLSFERYVKIREEALAVKGGTPLHLEMEVSREEYETLIRSLVESTLDSVSKALRDAGKKSMDMDAILLVGGSTRTPLVTDLLIEHTGLTPRQDVHPDLCVALGAGVLASRLSGHSIERVLVDVSPYSFGISYLGERGGVPYPHCFRPIIRRNVPLPLTRTESYFTSHPFQTHAEIQVYQGEDEDALKNILVGDFHIDGLAGTLEPSELLCRMRLDLDGILEVTAVEKNTGKTKQVTIANALHTRNPEEVAAARKRVQEIYETREDFFEDGETIDVTSVEEAVAAAANGQASSEVNVEASGKLDAPVSGKVVMIDAAATRADRDTANLLERSSQLLAKMHEDDREEALTLLETIESATKSGDSAAVQKAAGALRELLFFVEGQPN